MNELEEYKKKFFKYKSKKIVLYGIGIKTQEFSKANDFNFIGLMDKSFENIGSYYYGLKVLTINEVLAEADIIIIMSADVYYQTIFSRIEFLTEKHNIPIYFCNGSRASEKEEHKNISSNNYWKKSLDLLKDKINQNEVVSFDIFDTLITRKVTEPIDLLYIVERKLKDKEFTRKRLESEIKLGNKATLELIYRNLPKKYYKGLELELELELELSIVRKDMIKALNYAFKQNKIIYLITDICHNKEFMIKLLNKLNIKSYHKLLISSELGKRKSDSTLWKYYKKMINNKKALHIGDNYISDIKNLESFGIQTFHILSPYEILKISTLKNLVPKICTLDESILMGNIISKIFNSPFSLSKTKGTVKIKKLKILGYFLYAPILFKYITWIVQKNIEHKHDLTLFIARDGYFLMKLYNKILTMFNIKTASAKYLITSRVLLTIINIYDNKSLKDILKLKFEGTIEDFFKIRFAIKIKNKNLISIPKDLHRIEGIIKNENLNILKKTKKQRELYLQYLKKILQNKTNISLVEPSYRGTIQFNLSKLDSRKIHGYYCNADLSKDNIFFKNNMSALFQNNNDLKAEESNLRKNTVFFEEGILVSPKGTCLKINNNLTFNYSKKLSVQNKFNKKEKIFSGILDFFNDSFKSYDNINDIKLSSEFINLFIGESFNKNTIISKKIKDTFFYDSVFEKIEEGKIFD